MTILDRYYGRQILATLFKAIIALISLFILIDFLATRRTPIFNHDIPWNIVLRYYAVSIPQMLYRYQIAALAMLITTLLVLGNAAQHNEITAALAGGISLRRLTRIPVLIALLLTIAVFTLQETLGVQAAREAQRLDKQYFSANENRYMTRTGISWPSLENGWTCHILTFNHLALTGEQAFLLSIQPRQIQQIQAQRIYWDDLKRQWILEDGHWLSFNLDNDWEYQSRRIRQQPAPILESPETLFALDQPPDTKNIRQLQADIQRANQRGIPPNRPRVDLQAKFAQPALCFIMIWLAIPFALRIRRGGVAIGFAISIAIALAYLFLFRFGMALGYLGRVSPYLSPWFANALFLAIGLYLSRKNTA